MLEWSVSSMPKQKFLATAFLTSQNRKHPIRVNMSFPECRLSSLKSCKDLLILGKLAPGIQCWQMKRGSIEKMARKHKDEFKDELFEDRNAMHNAFLTVVEEDWKLFHLHLIK